MSSAEPATVRGRKVSDDVNRPSPIRVSRSDVGPRDVWSEGEDDEHRNVAHAPSQVADHFQRRSVGPVAVIDDEHHRRACIGERGAQPEHAVRNAGGRIRAGHGPREQKISGLPGCAVEQPAPLGCIGLMHRCFQKRPHHAVGEVTLVRTGGRAANPAAGRSGVGGRSLQQGRLSEPGRRLDGDDSADALLQGRQGAGERGELAVALDQITAGGARARKLSKSRPPSGPAPRPIRSTIGSIEPANPAGFGARLVGSQGKVQGRFPIVGLSL